MRRDAAGQSGRSSIFRGDAWTNPLSSDATSVRLPGERRAAALSARDAATFPDGVRLVLTLPPGQAISGKLTRDWVEADRWEAASR